MKANVVRDIGQTAMLSERGWRVLRFWERAVHEKMAEIVKMIAAAVRHGLAAPMV